MDNYGTHKTPLIWAWFAKRPRFHVHFTPTYGSWLNLIERWFAELTTKQLRRGVHRSVRALEAAISRVHRRAQRRCQALRLDQDRRRDPRQHRSLRSAHAHPQTGSRTYVTNHWDRTLEVRTATTDWRRRAAMEETASREIPSSAASSGRLHALDHLRAVAMFLGVLLHAAIPYMTVWSPWHVRDENPHEAFDVMVSVIHS